MERSGQHVAEFVPLANAGVHLYREVTGKRIPADVAQLNDILAAAATALAGVAPIYSLDPRSGRYRAIDRVEILFGIFRRGATILATPRAEHGKLAIRRVDMRSAIAILRRAGFRFPA